MIVNAELFFFKSWYKYCWYQIPSIEIFYLSFVYSFNIKIAINVTCLKFLTRAIDSLREKPLFSSNLLKTLVLSDRIIQVSYFAHS